MARSKKHRKPSPIRQCAALPCKTGEDGTMVMLVTSRERGRWVLPKGWMKKRLTGAQLAALEAYEEAGLVGKVTRRSIGSYNYHKRMGDGSIVACDVDVFPMRVAELLDDWPERAERQRRWFTLSEAADAVEEPDLAQLLRGLDGTVRAA
jgi:8-oxo-dGTP pyrophosphatase MutT (NUDIX family)